jgi:hypothetical protein
MARSFRTLAAASAAFGTTLVIVVACGSGTSSTSSRPSGSSDPTDPTDPSGTPPEQRGPLSTDDGGGDDDDENEGPDGVTTVPYTHFDVNHVLSTGQSNAVANGGLPVITTTQPYSNLMFSSGVMAMHDCTEQGCVFYDKPTGFVPLVEGDSFYYPVETMSSGLANEITKLLLTRYASVDTSHDVLVSLHGRSGHTYACLRKGGCDFKNQGVVLAFDQGMMEVADAMALAKAAGKTYVVRAVTAIHGESDHYSYSTNTQEFPLPSTDGGGITADYKEGLIEWQRDYEAGVKAITGQSIPVPLLISQMDSWTDVPTSKVGQWQYEAHVESKGKVVLVAPGYPVTWASDCRHYDARGERWMGEYFAKAYARIVFEGKRWEPVRPKHVTIAGNVITAKYYVPKPPLVFDTTRVTDPGNYGFEYWDESAAPPAITKVALTGPDTVQITLATAPTGHDRHLRYAYTAQLPDCPGPTAGPRGNLRDSDDAPSEYGDDLFDWGVHFDVPIP